MLFRSAHGGQRDGKERMRVDCYLMDGSTDDGRSSDPELRHKVLELPLTIFQNKPAKDDEPPLFKKLREHADAKQPLSFFQISGDCIKGNYAFTSGMNFGILEPNAKGVKMQQLVKDRDSLLGKKDSDKLTLPKQGPSGLTSFNKDYSDEPATQTTCALLNSMTRKTNVTDIEQGDSVWQINFVDLSRPQPGATIMAGNPEHVWFLTCVTDCSGKVNLFMREKAALSLSGLDTAEKFQAAVFDDDLHFPPYASIKVVREIKAPSTPAQSQDGDADSVKEEGINCFIVEAEAQNLQQPLSAASLKLLPLLDTCPSSSSIVVPASMTMLRKSALYPLTVDFEDAGISQTCTAAFVLVQSAKKSKFEPFGTGHRLTTPDVQDLLCPEFKATLVAYCSLNDVANFQLAPQSASGGPQTALVKITSIQDEGSAGKPPTFVVESVLLIGPEHTKDVRGSMEQMIYFATQACNSSKRPATQQAWTDEVSPCKGPPKYRRLNRELSGPLMEKFAGKLNLELM